METPDLDKEIDEALAELENEEVLSQHSDEDRVISEAVVEQQDWMKFDLSSHAEKLPPALPSFAHKFCGWMDMELSKIEDPKFKALTKIVFSQIRVDLTNKAYRERRKARAKDPVRKLSERLKRHEAKLKKYEEEKELIMAERLKLQQDPRYIKIAQARGLPLEPASAEIHRD